MLTFEERLLGLPKQVFHFYQTIVFGFQGFARVKNYFSRFRAEPKTSRNYPLQLSLNVFHANCHRQQIRLDAAIIANQLLKS